MTSSSTMRIQGKSFLKNATRQILEVQGIEIINTKKQLEDLISIIKYITEGNRYLVSSINIKNMIDNLPMDMNKISYFMYYSLSLGTIKDGNTFMEDIDRSMKKLIDVVSQERQRKIIHEKIKEEKSKKDNNKEEATQNQEDNQQNDNKETTRQPEVGEDGKIKIIDYIGVPKSEIDKELKQNNPELYNILHSDEDVTFKDIFNNNTFEEEDDTKEQHKINRDKAEKIINSSTIVLNEKSSYSDKFKYVMEKAMLYINIFENDTSNYLNEEKYKYVFINIFTNICKINLNGANNNKEIVKTISNNVLANINKENIDSLIKVLYIYEQFLLSLIQISEEENSTV